MEIEKLQSAIEAILFTMGESVELGRLAAAIGHDEETTRKLIHNMMDRYEENDRGIRIIELENSYQLCTKKELYEYLIRVAKQPKRYVLTDVLLETLSIIAYKQPVTKLEIEKIRGVKSDHAVNKLVEYGLVEEAGRLDAPGRPLLFGTTEEFLRRFSVQSLDDLPRLDQEQIEHFKEEAEAWVMVFVTGKQGEVKKTGRKELAFICCSGIATGASWLCYYRALQEGPASVVAPIDKLSVLVTVIFSYFVFGEKLGKKEAAGLALLTAGTVAMALL